MSPLKVIHCNKNATSPAVVIEIVPTEACHLQELKQNLRDADKKEIESFGISYGKALWRSYTRSLITRCALFDGKVAAVWGCSGVYMGEAGTPWLLTSEEVKKISPLRFARIYQEEVYDMLDLFPYLANYVDSRYTEAVRLLQIVGFKVGEPEEMRNGVFRKFEWVR